jgi:hypothetical protein
MMSATWVSGMSRRAQHITISRAVASWLSR